MNKAYQIAYDIADDKRRSRTAKLLLSFGERVQSSVSIVGARQSSYVRLKDAIKKCINEREDSVILINMGPYAGHRAVYERIGVGVNDGLDRDCLVF